MYGMGAFAVMVLFTFLIVYVILEVFGDGLNLS